MIALKRLMHLRTVAYGRLSAEDIHLYLLLSLGYSTGVIRECQAASSDNVVNQRKKRLSSKLQDDVLSLSLKPY